jgi:SAM-dependent methyltransferase
LSVFGAYARYYDLLYRDKNYRAEAEYVSSLIRTHAPAASQVLEIGAGTGGHASELGRMGYDVLGIDSSAAMLASAEQRRAALDPALASRLSFVTGDARTFRAGRCFDAVISLFHVMSYQTSNEDLEAAFATAAEHLGPGGVFVFDCWHGPAVLSQRPSTTVKRLADEKTSIIRIAEPLMDAERNMVDVSYTVVVEDRTSGACETLEETHRMRYLFTPEIRMLLESVRLKLVGSCAWMSSSAPTEDTWAACYVAVR